MKNSRQAMQPAPGANDNKKEFRFLALLLRNYQRAVRVPKIARLLLVDSRKIEDERIRTVARMLMFANGDWQQVKREIERKKFFHQDVRTRLFSWADKIVGAAA